jgi:hypothetical protein
VEGYSRKGNEATAPQDAQDGLRSSAMVAGRDPASDIDYDSQKLYGAAVHNAGRTRTR